MNEQIVPANAQVIRPQPSEDFNKLIQELTQMKEDIDLYLQCMNKAVDENGRVQYIKTEENPRINERGRREVMAWVQIYINPNVYLAENKDFNVSANYSLDQANFADSLFKNLQEYELSIENAIAIHAKVSNMMFHALQRSMTDKAYIFPQIKTDYGNPSQPMPEQKKWFGLF
jgi:hypothetical protein